MAGEYTSGAAGRSSLDGRLVAALVASASDRSYAHEVTDLLGDVGTSPPASAAATPLTEPQAASGPTGTTPLLPADRRRLRLAWTAGATAPVAAFAWLLMVGRWAPLQRQYYDNFFDLQARAFLDGRWDVPTGSVGFEGFLIDGRTHVYFGPWPALLRLPLLALTDRFDGRLTTLSMLLAMAVLTVAAYRLNVTVRAFVRGGTPVSRREIVTTAGLAVAVLSGPPLWLGSLAVVHHEAILWGLAFTVAAIDAAGRWLLRPTRVRLCAVAALGAAAISSRQSVGIAVVAGLALVAIAAGVARLRPDRAGPDAARSARLPILPVALVCGVLLVVGAVPNLIRFGNPFGPPMDRHIETLAFAERREFLAANDGAYFGLQFVPTTLLQYARPDALDLRVDFPWLDYPRGGPSVVGDVTFDDLDWSSSVPVAMPVLVVIAIPGVAWLVGAVRRRDRGRWLAALWVGTWAGAVGVLTSGYVAHRYVVDLMPIVLLPALAGAHVLLRKAPSAGRAPRRLVAGALIAALAFGTWTNVALGIGYQRERGKVVPEEWRAELLRWRADLPGGRPDVVTVPAEQPTLPEAADGTLGVVGDCLGLYVRVGDTWRGVDRGPGAGVHDIRVDLDALAALPPGRRAPVVSFGEGSRASVVALARLPNGDVRADIATAWSDSWHEGFPVALEGVETLRVVVDTRALDRYVMSGRSVLNTPPTDDLGAEALIGVLAPGLAPPQVADRYPGGIEALPFDPKLCRDVTGIR